MKPVSCPSCHGSAATVLPVRAVTSHESRMGFECAKHFKAPVQATAFLHCARCGMQFDKDTRVGGVK